MHVTGCSGAHDIPSAPARKKSVEERPRRVEKDAVKLTPCSIRAEEGQTMGLDA